MATAIPVPHITTRSLQAPFVNEAFVDFTEAENKRAMQAALADVENQLAREYDLVIGGSRLRTEAKIVSINPARPSQLVGIHQRAGTEHLQRAIDAAQTAFSSWSKTSAAERAELLSRT